MNECNFVGRLGNDVELKNTPNGNVVANFSVAVSEKDKQGNEHTEWIRCEAWGKVAGLASKNLAKGSKIQITNAKVKTRMWEKDGKKNYSTSFVVFRFIKAAEWVRDDQNQTQGTANQNQNFIQGNNNPNAQTNVAQQNMMHQQNQQNSNTGFAADDIPF